MMKNSQMRVSVGIFARSGSKGIKNKNILPFADSNLLVNTINHAKEFLTSISAPHTSIYVSTDSNEYASLAIQAGAQIPFIRPPDLARDESAEILSWKHMLNHLQANGLGSEIFLVLPVTAPLRKMNHIKGALNLYLSENYDLVFAGCESRKNPYLPLFEEDNSGYFKLSN